MPEKTFLILHPLQIQLSCSRGHCSPLQLCPTEGGKGFCSRAAHPALQRTCLCPTFRTDPEHHLLAITQEMLMARWSRP